MNHHLITSVRSRRHGGPNYTVNFLNDFCFQTTSISFVYIWWKNEYIH